MRLAICFRRDAAVFRLVWMSESNAGLYLGVLGGRDDSHVSYHADGTRHFKIGSEYHNRFSDVALESHRGAKQIDHLSLSMTEEWFNAQSSYPGDQKTETIVLLDERLFRDKDTCALDVWLFDRASEAQFLEISGRSLEHMPAFSVVGEVIVSLDFFPNHKIALVLQSARIRDVKI